MIVELRTTKTANFYVLQKRLSNAAINELFRTIRASQPSASQNFFFHRRERYAGVAWSAISFLYEHRPPFLNQATRVRERVCGFMLLVEHRGHVAVFKARLEVPAGFTARFLGRVSADRVDAAVARSNAVFERIRLRNMSVSRFAMRSKTLEAADLANVVGPASASRYVPQGYSVRAGADHYSATPSTGRIAQRSDRIEHEHLIEYARAVIDELAAGVGQPSAFIRTFARAIDLASISGVARPTVIAIDVAQLVDALYDEPRLRLVRSIGGTYAELPKIEVEAVLAELDAILKLKGVGRVLDIIRAVGDEKIGEISINKSRVALRSLELPLTSAVEVERLEFAVGNDPERLNLRSYLDKQDAFILLFDDLSLAYIDGILCRDEVFTVGGGSFLRYLQTDAGLAGVTGEKGSFSPTHTEFDKDSTFGVVVRSIAADDDVLLCDDLNDEWADFIGLSTRTNPTRISFYHAKHGSLSLGAGPFHVSVSQAIKNLGRMSLPSDAMPAKIARWRTTYNNNGVRTAIPRVSRGDARGLEAVLEQVRTAPDTIKRVCIVTSSLSKSAVKEALAAISRGEAPDPYFVQLYWLLMSFFSACTEVGAFGYVICQE